MNHVDLFSGIGGFALAARNVWGGAYRNVCFCEINKYCQAVLRKNFGKDIVIYDDIRDLTSYTSSDRWKRKGSDGETQKGLQKRSEPSRKLSEGLEGRDCIDLLTGGFPCQPFSQAGKRKGTSDERHLWPEMLRVIREFRPTWVVAENVRGLLTIDGGVVFETCCSDLEREGYDVQPFVIPACAVGAPHRRDRVWIVAKSTSERSDTRRSERAGLEGRSASVVAGGDASDPRREHGMRSAKQGEHEVKDRQKDASEPERSTERDRSRADTNTSEPRGKRRERRERREHSQRGARVSGRSDTGEWDQNWLEVATRFCGVFNGLSDFLDRYFSEVTTEEDYGAAITKNGIKELRILREAIQSEEVWSKLGGWHSLEEKEVLLSLLCRIEERSNGKDNLSHQGEEAQGDGVRGLWLNAEFRRSPQRHEYQEQLAREYKNLVPQVSLSVAQAIAKTWDIVKCAYASVEGFPGEMDGATLSKAGHRVERLKALGNAIVPQVAEQIMKSIKEIEQC